MTFGAYSYVFPCGSLVYQGARRLAGEKYLIAHFGRPFIKIADKVTIGCTGVALTFDAALSLCYTLLLAQNFILRCHSRHYTELILIGYTFCRFRGLRIFQFFYL